MCPTSADLTGGIRDLDCPRLQLSGGDDHGGFLFNLPNRFFRLTATSPCFCVQCHVKGVGVSVFACYDCIRGRSLSVSGPRQVRDIVMGEDFPGNLAVQEVLKSSNSDNQAGKIII